ncbi:TetR/AcrR family transcriptional regulator [Colwellia sp. Arc7-635]|uniref:TetR/AcrR family transcriptional regulator n=1 Tax=Colwellia sp. Arc7-635 TaxID=2497879 RepID=UPI000F851AB1|nr:helix-turn-helix domain-containing protein [Colwellia sp. Arc7-635]AZQ83161.1 TetR/AcrR family transcriptional regulator [Colwellia sp. Arc7-635]
MSVQAVQRGTVARQANKLRRRSNILNIARELICARGFDDFTISELANIAEVTIPTIHNLFGKKIDIFQELVEEMVIRIQYVLVQPDLKDPIDTAETFIDNLLALYKQDESFYRAAFLAGERAKLFEHGSPTGIFRKSLSIANEVCLKARENGYLLGRVDQEVLAKQLFSGQRLARHDWINGYIDLAEYRTQVLTAVYLTFLADASATFSETLHNKIKTLLQTSN